MRSKVTFLGTAVHPMLVPIPLGAFPIALVFDVLFLATRNPGWWDAAWVAILIGLLGTVAAAVPGLVDYTRTIPRRGQVWTRATQHLTLGLIVAVVFLASLVLRLLAAGEPGALLLWSAFALNLVGNATVAVQGHLGGLLVERHHVGVEPAPPPPEPGPASGRGPAGGAE